MKSFFWRIVICLVPMIIASLITWDAWVNDKFKWGVDLSGGTILVYEIDTRKLQEQQEKEAKVKGTTGRQENTVDYFKRTASELASALKRRIDPTATYNIVVRPAGSEGRVEIILPTGGAEQAQEAEKAWVKVLDSMKEKWGVSVDVPRGQIETLVERIQKKKAHEIWRDKLLNTKEPWNRLLEKIGKKWEFLSTPVKTKKGKEETPIAQLKKIPPGHIDELATQLTKQLGDAVPPGQIDMFIKQFAWEELIHRLIHWDELKKALEADLKKQFKSKTLTKEDEQKLQKDLQEELKQLEKKLKLIPPDSNAELIGRIQTRGNVIEQAVLDAVQPLMGHPSNISLLMNRDKLEKFVTENYGPSEAAIEKSIKLDKELQATARSLTSEKVQQIKDLVARVGALEFKILANKTDDGAAIKDAEAWINDTNHKEELEKAAVNGLPPPGPRGLDNKTPKKYTISLGPKKAYKSIVTYSWVEIGKQERKTLGFNNAARTSPLKYQKEIWDFMNAQRNRAVQVEYPNKRGVFLWNGALFYSREVKDRNMPEKERREKKFEYFVLARNPEFVDAAGRPDNTGKQHPIDGRYLRRAYEDMHAGRPQVAFVFYPEGGNLFGTLTRKNIPTGEGGEEGKVKRHLAIILDGLIMSAPTINSEIRDQGVITGDFTVREVRNLVNILRSGALPATLKPEPVSETTIGALLGRDTIEKGRWAIIWAFVGVLFFMLIYYRFAGLVACVALFANLILTVGFMVFVQATFTLPGLAGLVLMLGMAVDANVLIYERLREERDRGASLALALRNGYERAFPTIIDTHLSSIFTAVVLYAVGNDALKGFGISLTVGLIISLFTSLYMTRTMFDFWLANGWLRKLSMMRLLSNPRVNFMSVRHLVFTASVVVTLLGLTLFLWRTPKDLGIDFKGGTAFGAQLVQPTDIEGLRKHLNEDEQKKLLQVKDVKQLDNEGRLFKITYGLPGENETQSYTVTLANRPDGTNAEEREANLKERASALPDWSVEMLYPTKELEKMKDAIAKAKEETKSEYVSPFFNVRTSEMERELVQIILNQLLQDKGKSLLQQVTLKKIDTSELGGDRHTALLEFSGPASPSYFQSLLHRSLRRFFIVDADTGRLEVRVQLDGEGRPDESGRFQAMKLTFESLKPNQVSKVEEAMSEARENFNRMPQPLRLENFDSELAADTRFRAMGAIFASWLAVVLYLWFRFGNWTFGLAAVLCLVHDLCFTLGLVALSAYVQPTIFGQIFQIEDFKIDFTGVAALLTLVGYSVADTIVVFDRIREVRGKNPELTPQIINDSVNQTLSRTLLTSGTTFIVVAILFFFGGPGIHLFAFIMSVGVLVGTFSSIYIASPLLLFLGEGRHVEKSRRERRSQPAGATA